MALAQLVGEFPTLTLKEKASLRAAAEAALHRTRKELLDNLSELEKNQPSDFRLWLAKAEERYRTWLSRL
jgi:hypothetical protein